MKTGRRLLWKKVTAWLLVTAMVGNMAVPAYGYPKSKASLLTVEGKEGEKITEDASWKERFPNGTFAFKNAYQYLHEGSEEAQKITVYRLGGTEGAAVANICVTPAVTQDEEGTMNTAYAAGYEDFTIEVETCEEETGDDDSEASPSDAENKRGSQASPSDYGSGTTKQKSRKKAKRTVLDTSGTDQYDPLYFDLEFQDGEYAKDIIVRAVDDDLPETMEFAMFTIYDCEGAEFTETANGMTLGIYDDEEAIDSSIGFSVSEVRADKASGQAVITVTRTEGLPYVAQCSFRTVDGTAAAGRDYAKQEGVVTFAGGVDESEIVIQLIDDEIITEDEISFKLELYGPKAAVIDKEASEATVYLYNSGDKKGKNLATMLYTPDADDISSFLAVSDEPVIQNEEDPEITGTTPEPSYAKAEYTPGFGTYNPFQRTVNFGELNISLDEDQKKKQWSEVYDVLADKPVWEVYTPKASEEVKEYKGGDWLYKNKLEGRTSISFEDMYERYSEMSVSLSLCTDTRGSVFSKKYNVAYAYIGGIVTPVDDLPTGDGAGAAKSYLNNLLAKDVLKNQALASTSPYVTFLHTQYGNNNNFKEGVIITDFQLNQIAQLAVNANQYDTFNQSRNNIVGMIESQSDSKIDGGIKFQHLYLTRIPLLKNPKVLIHTADDASYQYNSNNKNISCLKPDITLDVSKGGINGAGKLYIGSTLNITDSKNAGPYTIFDQVFLASDSGSDRGKVLAKAKAGGSGQVLELGIDPDQKLNKPLSAAGDYSINVIMNRTQNVKLNYSTSISAPGDTADTEAAVRQKLTNALANATVTYRMVDEDAIGRDVFDPNQEQDLYFKKASRTGGFYDNNSETNFTLSNIQNIKTINFNLSEEDRILYNNSLYKGNADIEISPDHYSYQNITFSYYDKDHVGKIVKMNISINKVATYLDKAGDGVVHRDKGAVPYQTLSADEYLISELEPVMADGKLCQQLLEVTYTLTPRCLVIPAGKTGKETCEIVPNFVTTAVSEGVKAKLTPEMREYRQITGKDNEKLMYGPEAWNKSDGKLTFPLGGDFSPPVYNTQTETYTWTPQWKGNLSRSYGNPAEIVLDNTAMPDGFKAAVSREAINNYLGSFHGDDSFTLMVCYTENENGSIVRKTDDTEKGTFKAIPEKGSTTLNLEKQEAEVDTKGRPEEQPNLSNSEPGVELPSLEVPAGPLSFVMDENTLGLTLGISLLSYTKDNSVKSNTESNEGVRNTYTQSKESINQLKDLMNFSNGNNENVFQKLKDYKNTNTGDLPGVSGGNSKPARKAVEIASSISLSFMWEYSETTNKFEFQSASIFLNVGGSVTVKKYLDVCPIVYCYISFGASMDAGLGLEVNETVDQFGNRDTQVEFSGAQISLSVFLEAGAGLGIEVLSAEIFLRGSVTVGFIMGKDGNDFEVNEFITRAAVGFRVVLIAITFEMEAISIEVGYKADNQNIKNWYWKWTYFGNEGPGSGPMRRSLPAEGSVPGFKIKLPDNTYYEEGVYTPEDNLPKDEKTRSYEVDGMPFEVSGYSNSVSAAKLADGISLGSKYKLLTLEKADGEYEHYILYLASRPPGTGDGIHATALMLSRLGYIEKDEKTVLGLLHPVDSGNLQSPYLILDDDVFGDVDFGGSIVDGKLHAVWTSYTEGASKTVREYEQNPDSEISGMKMMSGLSGKTAVKSTVIDLNRELSEEHKVITLATASDASPSNYRYLPQPVNENTSLFVQTVPYTEEELNALQEKYEGYYESGNEGNTPSSDGTRTGDPYARMKYEYQLNMAAVYGKTPGFGIAAVDESGKAACDVYTMENWEKGTFRVDEITTLATSSNAACVAYAVTEEKFPEDGDGYEDIIYVKKLYLQGVEFPGDGSTAARWGKPKLLRTLAYSENGTEEMGVYGSDGAIDSHTDGAYFANLKFLNADVGGGKENIFLFNMNGDSYYISEEDVEEILSSDTPDVSMVPVFSLKASEEKAVNTQNDVTIAADPEGSLVAVYSDQVPNTTNNALYISRYDAAAGIWSDSIMLAMNQMQIYEDSVRYGWSEEESAERYFLDKEGLALKKDADKFVMSAPEVALGLHDEQLVILFQGITTPLTAFYYGLDESGNVILAEEGDRRGNVKTSQEKTEELNLIQAIPDSARRVTTGFYALAYGVGSQAVGDARLTFLSNRFIPGERLIPSISFKNTGDTAIRGSENQPVEVKLHIAGVTSDPENGMEVPSGDEVLAEWQIKGNIPAGRSVSIADMTVMGQALPLPESLNGRVLYFTVNEDEVYTEGGTFYYSSFNEPDGTGRQLIQEKPELLISDFTAKSDGLPEVSGRKAGALTMPLNVNMTIKNAGVKGTGDVRFKIGYTMTEDGEEVFYDIRDEGWFDNGYSLKKQEDGTFKLLKEGNPAVLPAGRSILLNGVFQVSSDYFDSNRGVKGMKLSVELLTSEEEYDHTNNTVHERIKTATAFVVPERLNLTVNTPVYIPVRAVTMDNSSPQIAVEEIVLSGESRVLENVSYNAADGKMMLVPGENKSSGVVRISDAQTGSYKDIVFNVSNEGININTSNELLTFKGDWEDIMFPPDADLNKRPYMDDTASGKAGSSFTFTTYADHMDLYFNGKIKITSINDFGYTGTEVSGTDVYKATRILFGNEELKKHTVTIEVAAGTAEFDRFVEHYSSGGKPWKEDKQNPWIIQGKSYPEAKSLKPGDVFRIPYYIVDDRNLSSVFINGENVHYETGSFAWGTLNISENGTYRVMAADGSGNQSQAVIVADWFDETATGAAADAWPEIIDVRLSDENGTESKTDSYLTVQYDKGTAEIQPWSDGEVSGSCLETKETVNQNTRQVTTQHKLEKTGYYLIEVTGEDGAVSRRLFEVAATEGPELIMKESSNNTDVMYYSAGGEGKAPLAEIAIYDGTDILGPRIVSRTDFDGASFYSGEFSKTAGGVYYMTAKDTDGKTSSYLYSPDALIESITLDGKALEGFIQEKTEYEVWIPYGVEKPPVAAAIPKGEPGNYTITYKQASSFDFEQDSNIAEIRVEEKNTARTYRIIFRQQRCTCDITALWMKGVNVVIGWKQPNASAVFYADASAGACVVDGHRDSPIHYEFELVNGTGAASVTKDGVLTCGDSGTGTVRVTAWKADGKSSTALAEYRSVKEICTEVKISDTDRERNSGTAYVRTDNKEPVQALIVDKNKTVLIGPSQMVAENQPDLLDDSVITLPAANSGYIFDRWESEDGRLDGVSGGTGKESSVTADRNRILTAYFKDVTPPECTITVDNHTWKTFFNTITFGLFFQKRIRADITAFDNDKVVRKEYLVSEKAMTLEELEDADWKETDGTVYLDPDQAAVLYARITDRDGNYTIVNSDGIVVDATEPELYLPEDMTEFSNRPVDVLIQTGDSLAGIDRVTYTTDEKVPQKGTVKIENGHGTVRMENEGVYTLHVTAKDRAGNERSGSMMIKLDLTVPELRVTGQSERAQVPYRVEIEAADKLSGLKRVVYSTDESGQETVIDLKDGKGEIITYKRDDFVLIIRAEDISGNESVVRLPLSLAVKPGGSGGSFGGSGSGSIAGPGKQVTAGQKRLHTSDGSPAANVWVYENGQWYRAGEDGFALTGWFKDPADGYWYYLREDGAMAVGWILLGDSYYYLNPVTPRTSGWEQDPVTGRWLFSAGNGVDRPLGAMYANTMTPDGYRVDENGKWIQN